jgi:NAD(P)-dependent dehydrogenase (short-subunit alcohol dehydrogenase family)
MIPADRPLTGKRAVITGASRGIGKAIAELLAQRGADVGLIARSRSQLDATAETCRQHDVRVAVAVADVTDSGQVAAAAHTIRQQLGTVDIVVNNAGVVLRHEAFDITDDQWQRVMTTNVDGAFRVTRAFFADLKASRGRIINIGSIASHHGTAQLSAYCASKHALLGWTRAIAEELRPLGIVANAVCPGSVDTDMLKAGLPGATADMTPQDIAGAVYYLAQAAPPALTGTCIDVFG